MRRLAVLALAVLLAAPPAGSAQTQLGRLFTTPEQRAELNEIRSDPDWGKAEEVEAAPVVEQTPEGPVVPHVTINGVVFRSSGLNASWINGFSVPSTDATREGIRVETRRLQGGGAVQLSLPGGLSTVEIKPGQKIDLLNGGVFEAYELKAEEDSALFEDLEETADKESSEVTGSDTGG